MIADYLPLLSALVALLVGLAAGKAWERYKLHEGRWIDRRKARQSPHYIQGLNFLVANQLDHAIEDSAPVRPAIVIACPADPPRDAIRVQIHGREVVQRRELDTSVEVAAHRSVASVVVLVE